jgi:hypothetical protein
MPKTDFNMLQFVYTAAPRKPTDASLIDLTDNVLVWNPSVSWDSDGTGDIVMVFGLTTCTVCIFLQARDCLGPLVFQTL